MECTGLFPHELDPKNCSICRAAATQEDLLKMEQEANVDFLFEDVPKCKGVYSKSPTSLFCCSDSGVPSAFEDFNNPWWGKLWKRIKRLLKK